MSTLNTTKTKQNVELFDDDIYLINAILSCSVASSRCSGNRALKKSLFDIISESQRDELKEKLFSIDPSPFTISTSEGEATVYKTLFHSTLLFILQLKNNEQAKEIECLNHERLLSSTPSQNELRDLAYDISRLCGCPINVTVDTAEGDDILYDELLSTFDMPFYAAALISILLLARSSAKERRAELVIKVKEKSPLISVIFEPLDDKINTQNELSPILHIASQNRMLFHSNRTKDLLEICFEPTRRDFSLLGIKAPLDFTWDDEEPTA